ncbi:gas vesicle protein GvpO [Pseudonocardia sp. NPDC049154]|uniref:gas vesicle protein GvpO n=1 Tax=Pseudonocardia sp. NPDC049154 TaxID=3155501 RepID=UPI003411B1A8
MADEDNPTTPRRRRSARTRPARTEKAAPASEEVREDDAADTAEEEPVDDGAGEEAAGTGTGEEESAEEESAEEESAEEESGEEESEEDSGGQDGAARERRPDGPGGRPGGSIVRVARRAAEHVRVLTGRHPETVVSIEPRNGDWCVGVEVVETHRIPDSADILAIYEVLVRPDGDLLSYRRVRRYTRGQVDRPWR